MPSTVIRSHSYDADAQELIITFVTGRRYAYERVPPEAYREFKTAFAKGVHFNRFIRDHYACRELARMD